MPSLRKVRKTATSLEPDQVGSITPVESPSGPTFRMGLRLAAADMTRPPPTISNNGLTPISESPAAAEARMISDRRVSGRRPRALIAHDTIPPTAPRVPQSILRPYDHVPK